MQKQNDYNIEDIKFLKEFMTLTEEDKALFKKQVLNELQAVFNSADFKEEVKQSVLNDFSYSLSDTDKAAIKSDVQTAVLKSLPKARILPTGLVSMKIESYAIAETTVQASGQGYAWGSAVDVSETIPSAGKSYNIPANSAIRINIDMSTASFIQSDVNFPISATFDTTQNSAFFKELDIALKSDTYSLSGAVFWSPKIHIDVFNRTDHAVNFNVKNIILNMLLNK